MIDQELPSPDLHAAHDVVVREGRRLTRRKRTLGVGLAAAAVLAALFAATRLGGPVEDGRDRVPAEDPTGVGDAFRSGFLAAVSKGLPLEAAAQLGCAMAALVLRAVGSQAYEVEPAGLRGTVRAVYGPAAEQRLDGVLGSLGGAS